MGNPFEDYLNHASGYAAKVAAGELTEAEAAEQLAAETGLQLPPKMATSIIADPAAAKAVMDQVIEGTPTDLTAMKPPQ